MAIRKNEFKIPYIGIEDDQGVGNIYNKEADHSSIIKITNPVLQYSADTEKFHDFHSLFDNIVKILGAGYVIQKHDIFAHKKYIPKPTRDFLDQKYNQHFDGRDFTEISTYLIITRTAKISFIKHSDKEYKLFHSKIKKVIDLLTQNKLNPIALNAKDISEYTKRVIALDFGRDSFSFNNFKAGDDDIRIGEDVIKSIALVDVDSLDFPTKVSSYKERNDIGKDFPVDTMSFLHTVPNYKLMIYNQVIIIPDQRKAQVDLDQKMRRHKGVPDPENDLSVEDIGNLLKDVAKNNQMIVYAHYNLIIRADQSDIEKAVNYVESSLFTHGILPSKSAYNQLELFRAALPGNSSELKKYDKFLTTSDAALCFFFKECLLTDEESTFQIYFSDRQGVPVAIDPTENPMITQRISNRNKFVLGPSGSGKSFFMNHLIRQYALYNTDIVLIDTGHSYSGICDYYNGRYITYSEEKPITMNPFRVNEQDLNTEKKQFLQSLIGLLWKGNGQLQPTEATAIADVIVSYYKEHFDNHRPQSELSFDTFYEYSIVELANIMKVHDIEFSLNNYKFLLKKFYKGGEYETILNDDLDSTLLEEPFIVFEIDAIKEHPVLFPITTLIIMDVFTQKMRLRPNRKALIIEEAWKAIASPTMAAYILYIWKTVRKFFGEAVVVTQELDDILGNEILKDAILANSDTRCLLDQSKFRENYDEVAKLLSLSKRERNKIFTINQLDNREGRGRFKEVYISIGGEGQVVGVENSFYEYLIFTTERKEKEAVSVYKKNFGSIKDAVEAFVPDFNASGLNVSLFCDMVNATNFPYPLSKKALQVYKESYGTLSQSVKPFIIELKKSGLSTQVFCELVEGRASVYQSTDSTIAA
jgi:conjugation system TraG family ATPase